MKTPYNRPIPSYNVAFNLGAVDPWSSQAAGIVQAAQSANAQFGTLRPIGNYSINPKIGLVWAGARTMGYRKA